MVPGQGEVHRVVEEVDELDPLGHDGALHGAFGEGQIQIARAQARDRVVGLLEGQGELHGRMPAAELRDRQRHDARARRLERRPSAGAPRAGRDGLELGFGFGQAGEDRFRVAHDRFPGLREPHAAALRSTRTAPASRSRAAICCETADWVKESASAAAENEPRVATSLRTFMRRTSSISATYTTTRKTSFVLMRSIRQRGSHKPPAPTVGRSMIVSSHPTHHPSVVIRPARGSDAASLVRLAALDSAAPLAEPSLVARWRAGSSAALAPGSGARIADPFVPTTALLDLLERRARPARATRSRIAWAHPRARVA
jgi:hypothetical protein